MAILPFSIVRSIVFSALGSILTGIMFTIRCTTCDARLAVKSNDLVGQILACPKCGGMVLVQNPEDAPSALDRALEQNRDSTPPFTTFPEASMMETESGILQPDEVERLLRSEPPPQPVVLAASEIRTRKIMLGVLVGLFLLLIVFAGISVFSNGRKGQEHPVATEPPAIPVAPEKQGPEPMLPHSDEQPSRGQDEETNSERLGKLLAQTPIEMSMPAEPETVVNVANVKVAEIETETESDTAATPAEKPTEIQRSTTDLLNTLERKMPGLMKPGEVPMIDIPAKLELPLAEMKLDNVPLLTVLRTFEFLTGVSFTLDLDEFRCRGIRVDTPVVGHFAENKVGDILSKILEPLSLQPILEDRQILVTVPDERKNSIIERRFDISDLVRTSTSDAEKFTPERLGDIVRRLVDPVGFADSPTPLPTEPQPSLTVDGDTLVVRHRLSKLDAALRILEQLRVIRGVGQTTEVVGEDLAPEVFCWDRVMQPMTLNYYQPTALAGVLEQIEAKTGLRILVDHRALHRSLIPLERLTATVRCNQGTVNEALENLLSSIDVATLTYRMVEKDVLEITTAQEARRPEKMSIEVHRYETPEKPLPDGETPEDLVKSIRSALEPGSWYDSTAAETLGRGDVIVDAASGCLLVRQSQPVQRKLRLWLGRKLSDEGAENETERQN